MGQFLAFLLLACVLIGIAFSTRGRHRINEQALNSPFRDKVIYRDLLLYKRLAKGLGLTIIVMAIFFTTRSSREFSNESKVYIEETLNVNDSSEKNIIYEGNKKIIKRSLNQGDPSY